MSVTLPRHLPFVVLVAIVLSFGASAQITTTPEVFFDAPAAQDLRADLRASARTRTVQARTELLAAADRQPQVSLSMFPDAVFRAEFASIETIAPGRFVWRARLSGIEDGEATIAVTDGVMAGQVTMPAAQYRIRYVGGNVHAIDEIDTRQLPPEREPIEPPASAMDRAVPIIGAGDDPGLIDVMVVYTPVARAAAGGTAAMASVISLAVGNTNNAYANSGVTQRIRLVYSTEVNYAETPNMGTDLDRLRNTSDGFMDEVHALRDTYHADFVTLLTDGSDACGIGYVMTSITTAFAPYAFNVTAWDCAGANLSFAHELGHNMGLHHDIANAGGGQGARPYAYGYQDNGYFRTVMAYENGCTLGCPRVQHFSTHTRTYGGRPTGVQNASENARVLNETAPTTTNFRQGSAGCTFSLSPTSATSPAAGGTGSVMVSASDSACAWSASSNASFLTITSSTSGTGNGAVGYRVGPNASAQSRSGTFTIAGLTFSVMQVGGSVRRVPGDFTGDGLADVAVFRPGEGLWYVSGGPTVQWGVAGDVPVPADYSGDGVADVAVFRRSTATWFVRGGETVVWGLPGDIPVPADYNGDGVADIAVFRPSTGEWHIRNIGSFVWGMPGDVPVPGDYDGDGVADIAVWRASTRGWHIRNAATIVWGIAGDVPVPADYDGNGTTDIAVWRPSSGTWFVKDQFSRTFGALGDVPIPMDRTGDGRADLGLFRGSASTWFFQNVATGDMSTVTWGIPGDIPLGRTLLPAANVFGDLDGDRKADITVFRESSGDWISLRSISNYSDFVSTTWGLSGDIPVTNDYDGDGKNDPAVYRPSNHTWYVKQSSSGYTEFIIRDWGLPGDIPVPGDYDGDRRADFAVYRPSAGRWVILLSSSGNTTYAAYDFGLSTDIPVPADYDGDMLTDIAVYRPSAGRWYILNRFRGTSTFTDWGLTDDRPVPADYDGDGKADLAVFRPSLGRWVILLSSTGNSSYNQHDFGLGSDVTVPGDYDGDGRADIAVFRPSTARWYILNRFQGTYTFRDWGMNADMPATKVPY